MIKIEMDVRAAAAVREALFSETKDYTYDPKSCPQRVVEIRNAVSYTHLTLPTKRIV